VFVNLCLVNAYGRRKLESARVVVSCRMAANGMTVGWLHRHCHHIDRNPFQSRLSTLSSPAESHFHTLIPSFNGLLEPSLDVPAIINNLQTNCLFRLACRLHPGKSRFKVVRACYLALADPSGELATVSTAYTGVSS
jgi:hypothetical protein